jgi:hypothetical protein
MRTILLALLTTAIAFAAGNQVAAHDHPFCIQGEEFGGGPGDCIFSSYRQCQATAPPPSGRPRRIVADIKEMHDESAGLSSTTAAGGQSAVTSRLRPRPRATHRPNRVAG